MSTPRTYASLDGSWKLAYDEKRVGMDAGWSREVPTSAHEIQLPTMQSQEIQTHGGVGWYFKNFDYDAAWEGRFVALQIAAATYPGTVWLNGTRLGDLMGGGSPASFPLSAHLQPESNLLAIRTELFAQDEEVIGDGGYYYPLDAPAGVRLISTARSHIDQLYIQPDIRRKRVKVIVEAPADTTVHLQIEGTTCHVEGAPGELNIEFPEFTCWSPESPTLYTLRADLIGEDGTIDSLSTSFGMREFTVKDERFYLNNRPLYVKSVSYVPQYPPNLKVDKLAALLKRELTLVKEGGFNSLRICGAPAPEALLDTADGMGILVFSEMAGSDNFANSQDWQGAVESLVTRDRNRPSLVAWCGVHVPRPDAPPSKAMPDSCAAEVRELDPSRLIMCDAPSDKAREGRSAALLRPYRDVPEPYESLETAIIPPVGQLARDYLRHSGDPDRLNYQGRLSVGGSAGWNDGSGAGRAQQAAFDEAYTSRQMGRCFASVEDFHAASRTLQETALCAQLDAVRSNIKMVGYGVESLCDGPGSSPFGLADVKRQAKPVLQYMKQVQQEARPVIQMYKTNLVPREEVGVTILLINEGRLEGRGELSLQVVGPTNQVLWKKKRLVKIPRHGREIWSGEIAASGSPGPHRFVVRLIHDRRVVGENSVDVHVVQPPTADMVEVNVIGESTEWPAACARLAKLHNFLAPIHIVPPLSNTIRAYPADDLIQVLAQVYEGAVAIVFSPPDDWNDLTEYVGESLKIRSRSISGSQRLNHHYAKTHPLFDGLPSRDLMGQPYQNILPLKAFEGESDEEMTGVHSVWREPGRTGSTLQQWWGSNITVKRLGAGRVVFTHFHILEHLGADPVADRLFVNLLQHFLRRSIPATEVVAADQKAVEWLRRERQNGVRKWMVIGSFPNWNGTSGHNTAYPPETTIDFDATYPGWYRAARWKSWNTRVSTQHTLDFTAALDSDVGTGEPCPYGTAYAYAEFSCDRRQEVVLNLKGQVLVSVWLNGALVHTTDPDEGTGERFETVVNWVKQGKNTVLIKCSKSPGPFRLSVDIEAGGTAPLFMNWWK